ncbi:MAG: hypothetical protein AAFY57_16470 [Cyanobacteria bacterium J06642_2]
MKKFSFMLLLLSSFSLSACHSTYATIENRSTEPLDAMRLTLTEDPEIVIRLPSLSPEKSLRKVLPSGFGESSLIFEATAGSSELSVNCGYLESDGLYRARIQVQPDLTATCEIDI